MINELIENKEKYFWSTSPNKVILGTSDKMGSAIIEFSFNEEIASITPVFNPEPLDNPPKTQRFNIDKQEYINIKRLYKVITDYLSATKNSNLQNEMRSTLTNNSTDFIKKYF